MLTQIALSVIGIITFLFLFWRRIREDYPSDVIFTTALYSLAGLGIGLFISRFRVGAWWFWLAGVGFILGLIVGYFRFHFRFFEVFEAAAIGIFPMYGLVFFTDSVINKSLASFLGFFVTVCLIALFYFLDSQYKNFSWYASGKVGFSGLATLGTFFLIRSLASSFFPFVLSFVGKIDAIISGICAFVFFLLLYNLSKAS